MFDCVGVKVSVLDGYSCSLLKLVRQNSLNGYVEITYMLSVVFVKATRVFWRVLLVVHKLILLFKWTPGEQQ
jgi:hypothetical protein